MRREKTPKKRDEELEELIKIADSLDLEELLQEIKLKEEDTFDLEYYDEDLNPDAYFLDGEEIEVELRPATTLSIESKKGLIKVLNFLNHLSFSSERDEAIKIIEKVMEEEGVD